MSETATESTTEQQQTEQQSQETKPSESEGLGDAGKRALSEERDSRKAAEKRARAVEAELEKLKQASQSAEEKALAQARKEGADEVTQRVNDRLKASEARALAAAAKFRNPATAVRLLDLSEVEVTDDGEVDAAKVKKLLEQLATDEPYLVDDGKQQPAAAASAGIGVSGGNNPLPTDPRARRLAILEQDIAAGKRNTN